MKKALFYPFLLLLAACEGPEGPAGPAGTNSLVAIVDEAAGANCTSGGVKITTGIDANANNTLDASEITETRYVCNGEGGAGGPIELRLGSFGVFTKLNQVNDYIEIMYADFDIANFPGYNSIQFVLKDVTVTDDNDDPSDIEFVVDAVDASNDDATIAGSQVTVNAGNYVSPNFYNNLPATKFDMAIRAHQKDAGTASVDAVGYLVISKTN